MSQNRRGETEVAKRWRDWIEACRQSGVSQAEFCRRHGLNQGTLSGWKTKLKHRADESLLPEQRAFRRRAGLAGFVEVRGSGPGERSGYEVVLAGNRTIRIPERFDPQSVSRLIAAVESC